MKLKNKVAIITGSSRGIGTFARVLHAVVEQHCMKKVNVSTKYMNRFAGKWVAIDTDNERIVAIGETLKDIAPLVTRLESDKTPDDKIPAAFKVPRKDEGPYVLCLGKLPH